MPKIKEKDPEWAGWPFRVTDTGKFPALGLYAKDCINFAKKFLVVAGVQRLQVRQLPASLQTSQQRRLEERADSIIWGFIDLNYASNYIMVSALLKSMSIGPLRCVLGGPLPSACATGATFKYIFLLRLLDPSMLDFDPSKRTLLFDFL